MVLQEEDAKIAPREPFGSRGVLDLLAALEGFVDRLLQLSIFAVSYTHLRAHETVLDLVCRLLLEKKKIQVHSILFILFHEYICIVTITDTNDTML